MAGEVGGGAIGGEDFIEGFLFGGGEADAYGGGFGFTGVFAEFFEFEEFEDGLGFGEATLFDQEISECLIGIAMLLVYDSRSSRGSFSLSLRIDS